MEACVDQDADYCDLTGEVQWVWRQIQAHHENARAKGTRIVHCCGFDSIPSDLGTLALQDEAIARHGRPCAYVNFYLVGARGGFSGGTAASMVETLQEAREDRQVRRVLRDPFSLASKASALRPKQREQSGVRWAPDLGAWTGPFIMAPVNERVVRRTNMLLGQRYGENFRYAEAQATGSGPAGWVKASGLTAGYVGFLGAMSFGPSRQLVERFVLPDAGEGPSAEQMDRGFFKIKLLGHLEREGREPELRAEVSLGLDPGYKGTALMLSEAACCLALSARQLESEGGVMTPGSAMGHALLERLRDAGMTIEVKD